MNGLSHLHGCTERGQFIISLIRGLGGNLNMKSRQEFTKEVIIDTKEQDISIFIHYLQKGSVCKKLH